ncbi:MAG: CvpA family protein [Chitinophagales bacterium]
MIFDIVFLIFIAAGFWWGYQKGIIYSLFSFAAYFIGIFAALKFSYLAVKTVNTTLHLGPKGVAIAAFLLVFILVVLLVRLIAWMLEQVLKTFSLNTVNQVVGGAIHALIALYVFCVFIWFLNKWDVIPIEQKRMSHVYSYIADLGPDVVQYTGRVIPAVQHIYDDFDQLIQQKQPHALQVLYKNTQG